MVKTGPQRLSLKVRMLSQGKGIIILNQNQSHLLKHMCVRTGILFEMPVGQIKQLYKIESEEILYTKQHNKGGRAVTQITKRLPVKTCSNN